MRKVLVGDVTIGEGLVLIAGPCVIENESSCVEIAGELKSITEDAGIAFIFKSSYDKANRSSISSFRGPGLDAGLKILEKVRGKVGVPVLSDIHCRAEVDSAASVLDVLQIPAFLCRQTDLVLAAARTGKPVNIKKGQFMAPWDVENIIEKVRSVGNDNIIVTERGTCFGYNNLVVDMRSLPQMREFGYPVVFDATHSVQLPGGRGHASGGQREFVIPLGRAAVAAGCDGLFIEVHQKPEEAPCDGPNMLSLDEVKVFLKQVKAIGEIVEGNHVWG
jgi:2-dehydro-3-deoxyphosphooctonate aldolase (KDO 8-P synthase)